MPGRVERRSEIVAPGEAELAEHGCGLITDRLHTRDDRAGISAGVGERPLQVVDYRQPLCGHPRHGVCLGGPELGGTPLAQVVQVGEGAQALVFKLRDARGEVARGWVAGAGCRAVGSLAAHGRLTHGS